MVLFLDRVYGIENQDFLLHVLDVGFLPDMRAAASLDTVSSSTQPGHPLCLQKGDTRWSWEQRQHFCLFGGCVHILILLIFPPSPSR